MTIERRYQPDPTASDELVELLYRLVIKGRDEAPGAPLPRTTSVAAAAACFLAPNE